MNPAPLDWPVKTHELHSHHFDSTIWNDLKFRDDDIVIGVACACWLASGEMLD